MYGLRKTTASLYNLFFLNFSLGKRSMGEPSKGDWSSWARRRGGMQPRPPRTAATAGNYKKQAVGSLDISRSLQERSNGGEYFYF